MVTGYVVPNGILFVSVLLAGIVIYVISVLLILALGQKYYVRGILFYHRVGLKVKDGLY